MTLREAIRDLRELFGPNVDGSGVGSSMRVGGSYSATDPSAVFSRGMSFGPKAKVDIHGPAKSGKIGKSSKSGKPGKVKARSKSPLATPIDKKEPNRAQGPNVRGDRGGAKPASGSAGRLR